MLNANAVDAPYAPSLVSPAASPLIVYPSVGPSILFSTSPNVAVTVVGAVGHGVIVCVKVAPFQNLELDPDADISVYQPEGAKFVLSQAPIELYI